MTYRVLIGLNVPVDDEEDARIRAAREAGTPVPMEERKMKRYEPGEIADYVPAGSVFWLIEQGVIEEVEDGKVRKR